MSTSMVASSSSSVSIGNMNIKPLQRSGLVRSKSKVGKILSQTSSTGGMRAAESQSSQQRQFWRPAGPRDTSPSTSASSSTTRREPAKLVRADKQQSIARAARRHGSILGIPSDSKPSLESSASAGSTSSLSRSHSAIASASVVAPTFPREREQEQRTSSESLPEFRSFSESKKRRADTPTPLVLGRSNGSSSQLPQHPQPTPNFLDIKPTQMGWSRRSGRSPPEPSASPSAATTLGSRGREAKRTTATTGTTTQTSQQLRSISNSLAPPPPDSGLLGLYPPASTSTGTAALQNADVDAIPTPLTPSFRLRAPLLPAQRRQKLQKLAWTLGEHVPPALVFPDLGSEALSRPQRSPSLGGGFAPRTPTSPARAALLAAETASDATSAKAKAKKYMRRRSASVGNLFALDLDVGDLEEVKGKNAKGVSRWRAPNEWAEGPSEESAKEAPGEQEQVAKWNAADYDLVMDRLRNLRR